MASKSQPNVFGMPTTIRANRSSSDSCFAILFYQAASSAELIQVRDRVPGARN